MPNLLHRTEEALLGALIYDPTLVDDVPYLLPRHFDHTDHQAIFAAFLDVRANEPDIWGAAMAEQITVQAARPGIDEARLAGLALSSPDVSSVAVYGRMVQEAALRRELAGHADRLAEAAGTVRGLDPELDHLALLSTALRSNSAHVEASLTYEPSAEPLHPGERTLREEHLLADLIQHPEHLREIATGLDPEVFTSPDRRSIYEAIVTIDEYGEPIEELTVAWEVARARSTALTPNDETIEDRPAAPQTPAYVARLAVTAVEAGPPSRSAGICSPTALTQKLQRGPSSLSRSKEPHTRLRRVGLSTESEASRKRAQHRSSHHPTEHSASTAQSCGSRRSH